MMVDLVGSAPLILSVVNAVVAAWMARVAKGLKRGPVDLRICSCGHGSGSHDAAGRCVDDRRREHYLDGGTRNGWEWNRCKCVNFDGQRPIDVSTWEPPKEMK